MCHTCMSIPCAFEAIPRCTADAACRFELQMGNPCTIGNPLHLHPLCSNTALVPGPPSWCCTHLLKGRPEAWVKVMARGWGEYIRWRSWNTLKCFTHTRRSSSGSGKVWGHWEGPAAPWGQWWLNLQGPGCLQMRQRLLPLSKLETKCTVDRWAAAVWRFSESISAPNHTPTLHASLISIKEPAHALQCS